METQNKHFIIVPFNKLPGDEDKTKEEIQKNILEKRNSDIMNDEKAMALLRTIGSDLNINAFCCNFFLPDDNGPNGNGKLNQDVEQANDLNKRIVDRLSISSPTDDPADIDLFLTSTVFEKELYGTCAENYKARVGVKGPKDLFVLRNVVMSPFPTDGNFIKTLAEKFKEVAAKEVEVCNLFSSTCLLPGVGTRFLIVSWILNYH
jgi:hypothetical protein